ncbi:unnamed protein product [Paramecium primaurelia]|uniref:Chromo domain-containing protein n=1 Tax=Paramecium primaurelia TaxID=5886 RepID=A0A8S1LS92_PARPR|nr:unnamed protein product [Paramecium primaurelia]
MIGLFVVEAIVGMRKNLSKIEYQVKWLGYSKEENTWELQENLVQNCSDLINQYHQNEFFQKFKGLIANYSEIKGNLRTDKPFQIVREFETQFLIAYYPRKNQFVGSSLINKSEAPIDLLQEFYCKQEEDIGQQEYQNQQIGCILDYYEKQSYVVLLQSKERIFVDNQIIIDRQPEIMLDYLENMNWITGVDE